MYHDSDHKDRLLEMMSSLSGFCNIWIDEGKSVYHDSDHKDRLL